MFLKQKLELETCIFLALSALHNIIKWLKGSGGTSAEHL